jgi:hypothetical protein
VEAVEIAGQHLPTAVVLLCTCTGMCMRTSCFLWSGCRVLVGDATAFFFVVCCCCCCRRRRRSIRLFVVFLIWFFSSIFPIPLAIVRTILLFLSFLPAAVIMLTAAIGGRPVLQHRRKTKERPSRCVCGLLRSLFSTELLLPGLHSFEESLSRCAHR